jgi:hypothetical protein
MGSPKSGGLVAGKLFKYHFLEVRCAIGMLLAMAGAQVGFGVT